MKRLPRSLDEIGGLRAARWIRESTAGQYDRYGPASQGVRLTGAAYAHGLALALPEMVVMARPTGFRRATSPSVEGLAAHPE